MRRVLQNLVLSFCSVLAICILWKEFVQPGLNSDQLVSPESNPESGIWPDSEILGKMIVMGRLSSENVDWVRDNLSE